MRTIFATFREIAVTQLHFATSRRESYSRDCLHIPLFYSSFSPTILWKLRWKLRYMVSMITLGDNVHRFESTLGLGKLSTSGVHMSWSWWPANQGYGSLLLWCLRAYVLDRWDTLMFSLLDLLSIPLIWIWCCERILISKIYY